MRHKLIGYIGITLWMLCCINIHELPVQAETTNVVLYKAENPIEVEEKKSDDLAKTSNPVKTGDDGHVFIYLFSLITTATAGGVVIKKIKERRKSGFEE